MDTHVNEIDANLNAAGLRFAILVSRFNDFITSRLLAGAQDTLLRHGAARDQLTIIHVPGAWELPLVAKAAAASGRFDALVALGCVIRGQTTHHIHVGGEAAKGLAQVALDSDVPVGFGVLTVDTLEQAIERAGTKAGNKGAEAALGALETVNLINALKAG